MFCPNCGKKIPSHSKFCPYCGYKVMNLNRQVPDRSQETRRRPVNNVPIPNRPKSHHKGFWAVLAVVVLLCGGVGVYHHMTNDNAQPRSTQSSPSRPNNDHQDNSPKDKRALARYTIESILPDMWQNITNDAGSPAGPIPDSKIYNYFQGGKNNHDFKAIDQLVSGLQKNNSFYHPSLSMEPKIKSIRKVGNELEVTYQVNYFFGAKEPMNKPGSPGAGLHEGFIWHATTTSNGSKIITNKADNKHPVYKHVIKYHPDIKSHN